jgi:hypothetical protein
MPPTFANPPRQHKGVEPITLRHAGDRISAAEVGILLASGAVATLTMALVHLSIRVPGHAILKPVLPLAFGLAFVARSAAGSLAGIGALASAIVLLVGGWGEVHVSALTGLVLLGPALDLAERGAHRGTEFILRGAAAGLVVNLAALGVKLLAAPLGWESGGGRGFATVWPLGIFTFAICGMLAGALCVAIRLAAGHRADSSQP